MCVRARLHPSHARSQRDRLQLRCRTPQYRVQPPRPLPARSPGPQSSPETASDGIPEQETVEHLKGAWRILKEISHLNFHGMDEKKKDDLRKGFPPLQLLTKEQQFLVNEL